MIGRCVGDPLILLAHHAESAAQDIGHTRVCASTLHVAVASITMSAPPQIHGDTNIVVAIIVITHNPVVHALQRTGLAYLGRYTDRTAIGKQRLVKFDGEHVQFQWRDYADSNRRRVKWAGVQAKSTRWANSATSFVSPAFRPHLRIQSCRSQVQPEQETWRDLDDRRAGVEDRTGGRIRLGNGERQSDPREAHQSCGQVRTLPGMRRVWPRRRQPGGAHRYDRVADPGPNCEPGAARIPRPVDLLRSGRCLGPWRRVLEAGSDNRQREPGSARVHPITASACRIELSSRMVSLRAGPPPPATRLPSCPRSDPPVPAPAHRARARFWRRGA